MQYFWCLHVAPSWLNFFLTRISLHSPSRNWVYLSNLLLVDDSLPHFPFLSVIWVTVFVNYLRSHHFLVLFCLRIGTCQTIRWLRSPRESPLFSVLSSGTVSPEREMDDLIHKFPIQVSLKWRSVLIDTNTRQVKALTRSRGCNVNMSAGRASI